MRNLLKKLDMVTDAQVTDFVNRVVRPRHLSTDQFTIVTVGANAKSVPNLNFHWGKVSPVVGSVVEVEHGYYHKIVAILDKKDSQK